MYKRLLVRKVLQPSLLINGSLSRQSAKIAAQSLCFPSCPVARRYLVTKAADSAASEDAETKKSNQISEFDYDNYDDFEPRTAGEQVLFLFSKHYDIT
jgi:hypothetical protein